MEGEIERDRGIKGVRDLEKGWRKKRRDKRTKIERGG